MYTPGLRKRRAAPTRCYAADAQLYRAKFIGRHQTAYAETIACKIIAALSESYRLGDHEHVGTCSIGATLFDGGVERIDELVKQADIAMYQSKKDGRNTVSFFDPAMQESVDRRAELASELLKALQNGQFQLYFQIQVDSWRHPIGAEALIRWQHPEHGTVSPAEFIPLAEATGLILPIGAWVLETACAQIKAWQDDPVTRALVLAVNVSARQLRQRDFVDEVRTLIRRHGIAPQLLNPSRWLLRRPASRA